ncbi:hypothetical protein ES705_12820 [subsurface metagenome]
MNIKLNHVKVNEKIKNQPNFPSQYVVIPMWILEDLVYNNRSSIIKSFVLLVARYTLGMKSECCFYSTRRLAEMMKCDRKSIKTAIKKCRRLGYIAEDMISIPEITSLNNGTKAYRLNFLQPRDWKPPEAPGTFFEAFNLTRNIEDIKLRLGERKQENNPDIAYLIGKIRSYMAGRITKKDFDDIINQLDK